MLSEDTVSLIENHKRILKMTKAKTATLLLMTIATFVLVFSMTEAHPTTEVAEMSEHLSNNSRLVIKNVMKTIEFEVGVLEDDGNSDENKTTVNATDVYETDIQLLNLGLLKEVVSKAEEELDQETTTTSPTTVTEQ